MKYCTKCGQQLEEHFKYCTVCQTEQPTPEANRTRSERNPAKKRGKVILGVLVSLLLLLVMVHISMTRYYDPFRKLDAMDAALSSEDQEAFYKQITVDDHILLDHKGYMDYIKGAQWDNASAQIQEQLEEKNGLSKKNSMEDGSKLFTLKPKSILGGLYKSYDFIAEPIAFTVESPMKDTRMDIENGDVLKRLDENEKAEMLAYPGSYSYKAQGSNMYGAFTEEKSFKVVPGEPNKFELAFEGDSYAFDTNELEAVLFIDDISTDRKLKEFDIIGPFPKGSKSAVHTEYITPDGKVLKSAKTPVAKAADKGRFEFVMWNEFPEDHSPVFVTKDEAAEPVDRNDVEQFMSDYRNAYEYALNNGSYSDIASYIENGSPLEQGLDEYISEMREAGHQFDFESSDVEKVDQIDDSKMKVTLHEKLVLHHQEGNDIDFDRRKIYTIVASGGNYKISRIDER